MYASGKEALDSIYEKLQKQVKEEVQQELQLPKEEEKKEESTQIPSIPLTMREQQALKQIENLKQQPILIPATLRDDLVAIQRILEKNGKNPELLEEVKKDIEFFDTEVVKHVSE